MSASIIMPGVSVAPPICQIIPKVLTYHGNNFTDNYFWLRDDSRTQKPVLDYLVAENEYSEKALIEPLKGLRESVYQEFVARLKEDDEDVPVTRDNYEYYKRTVKGLQYSIYCRKLKDKGEEEILLDLNREEFKHHPFLQVGNFRVSPDHTKVAYSLDITGGESYQVFVRDIASDKVHELQTPIVKSYYSLEWTADSKGIFYDTHDKIMRPYQIHYYNLESGKTVKVFEEPDDKFFVSMEKCKSGKFIFIYAASSLTKECTVLNAQVDGDAPHTKVFTARNFKHRYSVEHLGNYFYILSNKDGQTNYALYRTEVENTAVENWKSIGEYDNSVSLESLVPFKNFLVVQDRSVSAVKRINVYPCNEDGQIDLGNFYRIPFETSVYNVILHGEQIFSSNTLRYTWNTLIHPDKTIDVDLQSRQSVLKKEKEVLGGFDSKNYVIERHYAKSKDGKVEVPISLAYRKNLFKSNETNSCLLYGYGSYGISIDPSFRANWLTYMDRGFVVAIAHIRGGGDCGRTWYEDGKFLKKRNTFEDFVASAEYLVSKGITEPKHLAIEGRSAGGMLMGNAVNLRPDLYQAVIAGVPFVDVINTMMDESIPLTINEYEEWGNPNDKEYFDYMLSYSPYNHVPTAPETRVVFPNMLIRGGLHDPRVQYWEPAKYVAKIRASPVSRNRNIFMMMEMKSGHFGSSGRYAYLHDLAIEYAFVLHHCQKLKGDKGNL